MAMRTSGIPTSAALSCLFTALCCVGAYISIPLPIGPVPLVFTNLFAILSGLLLGPLWGSLSSIAYLGIGALGFPVFSGGRGGLAHLAGPLGGYLAGYILGSVLAGVLARKRGMVAVVLGTILGFASILALGAGGLKLFNGISWERALVVGVLPFLPGDTVKAILAALIATRLGPFVDSLTGREDVPV
ncbi:MAG: biotin transporter BioY [Rectinemataceae bacterium]